MKDVCCEIFERSQNENAYKVIKHFVEYDGT